jgi:zinc protease
MIMRTLLAVITTAATAAIACGPKPAAAPIPMLPGDGDSHVAKPPSVAPPAAAATPSPADPWSARSDLIAPPPALPPAAIELPRIDEFKLSNGLSVYVVKRDRLPVVSIQLAIRAGRMHEPRSRLGVAELTADMLVKGTRRRDAAALARAIDLVGGTIAADSTFEATLLSCSALVRHLGTCTELIPEMVTQPAFADAELAKLRDQLIGSARQRLDDPATLASAHAQNLLWGNDHVRGWINSEPSIAAIRRDDLVAWHRAWFVPRNALLVVTGDVDPKRLKLDLERAFGSWQNRPVPPAPSYPEPGLSGSRIRLVDRPGQTQTQIRIAQFGIRHDDARFFDTLVWNYVLGGGGAGSRLGKGLRGAGKSYTASSSFDRNIDRGSLVAGTVARNSDAVATARIMLGEIARLAKEGPSKDEVAAAIASITGGYGLRFQSAGEFGAAVVGAELHGFGREYLGNFPLAVGGVTVEDARRAAAEILDPKAYVIVLVGDAKDLEPQMRSEGWRFEKVPYTDPITPLVAPPDAPVDPAAAAAARKLIDEALAAKGGKARLAGLKAFRLTAVGSSTIQAQTVPIELARIFVLPDKMRIDATIRPPGAPRDVVISIGVSGKTGWQRAPDPKSNDYVVTEIAGSGFASADFERWREPELILLKAAEPSAKLIPAGDETIDGKPHAVVKLRSPFGEVGIALYIDKRTKLIGRMSYSDGGSPEVDDFTDYREVSGIKVAYKRTSTGGGRSTALELKAVEFDPKIDAAVFDKPAK